VFYYNYNATFLIPLSKDIAHGAYQLVVASPEYIEQDTRFRTRLWDSVDFRNSVQRVIFDEVHCMLDWGDFRPSYRRLSFLHPLIPHATIFALSATLTPTMVAEVKSLLGLSSVELIRLSNNRQNITYITKKMAHTQQSLHDLAFLVPPSFTPESPPQKFMVFMKSKILCERAAEFLRQRLPTALRDRIVWVHADMTRSFNERALGNLRDGLIYGIVCTDVAGMVSLPIIVIYYYSSYSCCFQGIDIPDVVNSTKTVELIPTFLNFFRSLYAPVSDHVTPALILAELPL
jgi:superfamily II DNA helicase RecQ